MKKKYVSRDILVLSVCTLITISAWIGFDVYRILTREEEPYVPGSQLAPFDPEIDQEIIDHIAQGAFWEKGEYLLPPKIVVETEEGEE